MQKEDDFTMYIGLPIHIVTSTSIGCDIPIIEEETYLTDELDFILVDETGAWLTE